ASLEHDFAAETIAHFEPYLVAVDDERLAREAIKTGRAVAQELVLHIALIGLRREGGVGIALARVVSLEAGHRAAVARELGDRESCLVVAEERGELTTLELQIKLASARRLHALLGRVAVQRVVTA